MRGGSDILTDISTRKGNDDSICNSGYQNVWSVFLIKSHFHHLWAANGFIVLSIKKLVIRKKMSIFWGHMAPQNKVGVKSQSA